MTKRFCTCQLCGDLTESKGYPNWENMSKPAQKKLIAELELEMNSIAADSLALRVLYKEECRNGSSVR